MSEDFEPSRGSGNAKVDSTVNNIGGELYAELQDGEIDIARQLAKISLRADGALIGVVIEGRLQKVAPSHSVKVSKHPKIAGVLPVFRPAGTGISACLSSWRDERR